MMRIVIFTDEPGWHGARLREAFAARGCATTFVSLAECSIRLRTGQPRVRLPGFGADLPDGAFVRGVAAGTLEEVVFRLDVLHALDAMGVPVYNDGRAIERSVDKSLTSFLLARAGLATPSTLVTAVRAEAEAHILREIAQGSMTVCKPLFGSQGKGLIRIAEPRDLPDASAVNGVWYLQRFVASGATGAADWRLLVLGGRVVASMRRSTPGWLTNVAQGGRCQAALPDQGLRALAERALEVLGMSYAGVDLMQDRDGGWWILEVNSIPAWRGLQGVAGVDIAGLLAEDLLRRCSGGSSREAV